MDRPYIKWYQHVPTDRVPTDFEAKRGVEPIKYGGNWWEGDSRDDLDDLCLQLSNKTQHSLLTICHILPYLDLQDSIGMR